MNTLAEAILKETKPLPKGRFLSPKDFEDQYSRHLIDKTFQRLVNEGKLLRIARGYYTLPVKTKFGVCAPPTSSIISALSEKTREKIFPHGVAAANSLGLSPQIPMKEIYVTGGKTRLLQIGKRTVEVRGVPRWQLLLGETPGGALLRALAWLGPAKAQEALLEANITKTHEQAWSELVAIRAMLPVWLRKLVNVVKNNA